MPPHPLGIYLDTPPSRKPSLIPQVDDGELILQVPTDLELPVSTALSTPFLPLIPTTLPPRAREALRLTQGGGRGQRAAGGDLSLHLPVILLPPISKSCLFCLKNRSWVCYLPPPSPCLTEALPQPLALKAAAPHFHPDPCRWSPTQSQSAVFKSYIRA